MANYLEVITAQANALQAELNLASIQRQQLDAMVELYRSLVAAGNNLVGTKSLAAIVPVPIIMRGRPIHSGGL
jgi:outer membrane protein TolC